MLQFGLFASHIPYIAAVLIYVVYFGMSTFHKNNPEKIIDNDTEKVISFEKSEKEIANTFVYQDYFMLKKEVLKTFSTCNQVQVFQQKFTFCLSTYREANFSRPPPVVS